MHFVKAIQVGFLVGDSFQLWFLNAQGKCDLSRHPAKFATCDCLRVVGGMKTTCRERSKK